MNVPLFPDLIVNGELVPHAVVASETQNQQAPKGKPGVAWRKAATAVAIRTLLLQEAAARGIQPDRQEVAPGKFETDQEAIIRALLDQVIEPQAPSDDAIRAEWAKDPDRFRTPPLWEVSHILCACDPTDDAARDAALVRATGLLDLARATPQGFAALASRESDCGSKSSGGALGQLGPGDTVPEFETALHSLNQGDLSPAPVLTRYGYHIIRLDARAEGQVLPLEAVRHKIGQAMEKAAWARAARSYVDQLVARAEISGAMIDRG